MTDYVADLEKRIDLLERRLDAYDFFVIEDIYEIQDETGSLTLDRLIEGFEEKELNFIEGGSSIQRLYILKGRGEEEIQFLAGLSETSWFPTSLDHFLDGVKEKTRLEMFVRHGKYAEIADKYDKLFGDRGRRGKQFRELPVEFVVNGR